jgi:flagellar basal body-associated protein FliL
MRLIRMLIIILLIQTIFFVSTALCAGPAPYTEEAFNNINAAAKQVPPLPYKDSTYTEERAYNLLEKQREIFMAAGYSYDATLKKVANDLQRSNKQIPEGIVTVAGVIVAGVQIMMSECGHQKIDCLSRYPADLAEAIRTILKTSNFSL